MVIGQGAASLMLEEGGVPSFLQLWRILFLSCSKPSHGVNFSEHCSYSVIVYGHLGTFYYEELFLFS